MKFKQFELNIFWRLFFILITALGIAALALYQFYFWAVIIFSFFCYQGFAIAKYINKSNKEVSDFVEAVHYRDFSRYFDTRNAPEQVKDLRKGFNEINDTFKIISREKETQYQYLQKILGLVETGIIAYNTSTGEIIWVNDFFKKLIATPYLKTIHSLEKRNPIFYQDIIELKSSATKITSVVVDKNQIKLLLTATGFQTEGQVFKLIAFQNINEAVDETEAAAWQKLLSVLTHEIMNSIAPISSLADTLKNRLQNFPRNTSPENDSMIEDLELGIETIRKRSDGLLKFAETYRNLNKITTLSLTHIYVRDLFETLHRLMQPTIETKNIELEIILKNTDLQISCDPNLLEQVLINLLLNAIEAVKENKTPKIQLSAQKTDNEKTIIKVADNGTGIPADIADKVFIPFFSTRKTGSGIGLSLCKQIILLHKGNIKLQSIEGQGTVFTIQL